MDRFLQVELFSQRREIVGVGVHLITIPRLCGTTMTSPVVRDDAKAVLAEEQHLCVPVVCGERPTMTENHWLSFTPVLVIDLCAVFCRDRGHGILSLNSVFDADLTPTTQNTIRCHFRLILRAGISPA